MTTLSNAELYMNTIRYHLTTNKSIFLSITVSMHLSFLSVNFNLYIATANDNTVVHIRQYGFGRLNIRRRKKLSCYVNDEIRDGLLSLADKC